MREKDCKKGEIKGRKEEEHDPYLRDYRAGGAKYDSASRMKHPLVGVKGKETKE